MIRGSAPGRRPVFPVRADPDRTRARRWATSRRAGRHTEDEDSRAAVFLARSGGAAEGCEGAAVVARAFGAERLGQPSSRTVEGMQQKVQFISTSPRARLLILTSPFSGMIRSTRRARGDRPRVSRKGMTVFPTHMMDQAERLCERVCLISRARCVLDGDLKEIKRRERKGVVRWPSRDRRMAGWSRGDRTEPIPAESTSCSRVGPIPRPSCAGCRERRGDPPLRAVEPRLHENLLKHAGGRGAGEREPAETRAPSERRDEAGLGRDPT